MSIPDNIVRGTSPVIRARRSTSRQTARAGAGHNQRATGAGTTDVLSRCRVRPGRSVRQCAKSRFQRRMCAQVRTTVIVLYYAHEH